MSEKRVIPIGMISDDNFIMPTSVAITSIICNKSIDTYYDIYVLMAECSDESKNMILSLKECSNKTDIHLVEVSLDKYKDIKQMAHISRACLLKFDLCNLINNYDKILYLDGDIIVRGDLWNLYNTNLSDKYAAAVKELDCISGKKSNVNAGIMLFNAKRIREENLSEKLFEVRKSLGEQNSMDQQSFNLVVNGEYKFISIKYNCIVGKLIGDNRENDYTIEKINELYEEKFSSINTLIENAIIIHFATSNKPWIYTFNPLAKEWYSYYLKSPFKLEPFKLRGRWGYRFDRMIDAFKKNGIKGIKARMSDKVARMRNVVGKKAEPWE